MLQSETALFDVAKVQQNARTGNANADFIQRVLVLLGRRYIDFLLRIY